MHNDSLKSSQHNLPYIINSQKNKKIQFTKKFANFDFPEVDKKSFKCCENFRNIFVLVTQMCSTILVTSELRLELKFFKKHQILSFSIFFEKNAVSLELFYRRCLLLIRA